MTRVLIISNMYPSVQKPYAGIFVMNQYKFLKTSSSINVDLFSMQRTFTGTFGSIIKYLAFYFRFIPFFFKRYDIIHIHFFSAHYILAYFYKFFHPKTKIIVTFHGSDYKNFIGNNSMAKVYRKVAKSIDFVIAVGSRELDNIKQYIHPKDAKVLCAGINTKKFIQIKDTIKEYDFLFIGSFYKIKGVDIFIDAIKRLDDTSIRYCFVGSGEYLDDIKKLQTEYNISLFLNIEQDKLVELYNKAKFLVLCSRADAFGLVVTESMYCGTPVIIAPTGGLLDQVVDGFNGFILKENTPQTLADEMKRTSEIKDDEYNNLCLNALNSNKQFSLENVGNELLSIYNSLTPKANK